MRCNSSIFLSLNKAKPLLRCPVRYKPGHDPRPVAGKLENLRNYGLVMVKPVTIASVLWAKRMP
jgi:hypothetical protein